VPELRRGPTGPRRLRRRDRAAGAAVAASLRLGIGLERAAGALAAVEAVFGRVETIPIAGKTVSILLIKNPAGANEVLRTMRLEADGEGGASTAAQLGYASRGLDLWIALNDGIADGRDVSWVWDADFELLAGHARRVFCSGTRAPEIALRLKYAGIEESALVVDASVERSFDRAVAEAESALFALPTYTALIELRTLLASRGLAKEFWR
jgi:lipid II isoglutaminyl synthase (glutamine-hydrolysing)